MHNLNLPCVFNYAFHCPLCLSKVVNNKQKGNNNLYCCCALHCLLSTLHCPLCEVSSSLYINIRCALGNPLSCNSSRGTNCIWYNPLAIFSPAYRPPPLPPQLLMFTFIYRNRCERVYKAVVAFRVCLQRVVFEGEALESKRLVERGGDSRDDRWRYR